MELADKRLIAVVGATGHQGGAVIRALTRNPAKHSELADEVVQADLSRTHLI